MKKPMHHIKGDKLSDFLYLRLSHEIENNSQPKLIIFLKFLFGVSAVTFLKWKNANTRKKRALKTKHGVGVPLMPKVNLLVSVVYIPLCRTIVVFISLGVTMESSGQMTFINLISGP